MHQTFAIPPKQQQKDPLTLKTFLVHVLLQKALRYSMNHHGIMRANHILHIFKIINI